MGLFSGVKKVFKKVGGVVKKAAPLIGTAVGGLFGGPAGAAAGSMVGGMAGGDQTAAKPASGWWDTATGLASSALDMFRKNSDFIGDAMGMYAGRRAQDDMLRGIQLQNASARDLADRANLFSQSQAREQMAFQERMSGTAHQREVQDLRAAGLNPILSGTGGMGASTPAGGQGTVVTPPVRSEGDASTTAVEVMRAVADIFKSNALRDFTKGPQTTAAYATAQQAGQAVEESKSRQALLGAQTGEVENRARNLDQEYRNLVQLERNLRDQGGLTRAQTAEKYQSINNMRETAKSLKMHGDIDASEYGKLMEQINRAAKNIDALPGLGATMKGIKALKGVFK